MKRKEVMELQKREAIEAFIGKDIGTYTEEKLGRDWRIVLEEKRITPYVKNLIMNSKYFRSQCKSRGEVEMVELLIYSRLIECRLMDKRGGRVKLNGTDKEKLISEVSGYNPDLVDTSKGENWYYEVISTFNGCFMVNSGIFVREGKIKFLTKFARNNNLNIVAVDVLARRFCFIPVYDNIDEMGNVTKGPYGYRIDIKDADWFSLDEADLVVDAYGIGRYYG